jgi:hypothetical protein
MLKEPKNCEYCNKRLEKEEESTAYYEKTLCLECLDIEKRRERDNWL